MIDQKHWYLWNPIVFFKSSLPYAAAGVWFAIRYNQNMRFHIGVGVLVVIASIFLRVTPFEMGILGVMILLVLCTEMINTAIEEMANLITKEHREEARIAKDVGAGMVLLTAVGSVIVGILIFVPHIKLLLGWK